VGGSYTRRDFIVRSGILGAAVAVGWVPGTRLPRALGQTVDDLPLSDIKELLRVLARDTFDGFARAWLFPVREQVRHRLSRAGNRKLNSVLHVMAVCQVRADTAGRAYYDRKIADGKTHKEAIRCLKRRLSDAMFKVLVDDLEKATVVAA
jgi:hypothetical protein